MIAAFRVRVSLLRTVALCQLTLAVLVLVPSAVSAQYKWTGRDGSVSYGDRPPNDDVQTRRLGESTAAADPNASLPFSLKSIAEKHPVVLYTASDCAPCEHARNHLSKRGIPFNEKQIRNAADAQAMEKLGFSDSTVPSMSVGRQKQVGYEASAFDGLLDIAGYPKTSLLPTGFRNANAVALTTSEAGATPKGPPPTPADAQRPLSRRERNNQTAQSSAPPTPASPNSPNTLRF
jgi:glutaredoxin